MHASDRPPLHLDVAAELAAASSLALRLLAELSLAPSAPSSLWGIIVCQESLSLVIICSPLCTS